MDRREIFQALEAYGREGVAALELYTPMDSGITAASWDFVIEETNDTYSITWTNSNVVAGMPLVIMLQYGHGTGTGGWVRGRDFINPAIQPVFDKIADEVWKEVVNA
jgi:hypothetical protein